jgi:hypothetical protein
MAVAATAMIVARRTAGTGSPDEQRDRHADHIGVVQLG